LHPGPENAHGIYRKPGGSFPFAFIRQRRAENVCRKATFRRRKGAVFDGGLRRGMENAFWIFGAQIQACQWFARLANGVAGSSRPLSEKTFGAATPSDKLYLSERL